MFKQSFLETTRPEQGRQHWIFVGSVAFQVALLAGFVVMPLLYPVPMPSYETTKLKLVSLAKVRPPVVVKKPFVGKNAAASRDAWTPPAQSSGRVSEEAAFLRPATESDDKPTLLTAGGMGSDADTVLRTFASAGGEGENSIVVAKPKSRSPLNISRGVSAGLLLSPIRPVYPEIARMARITGTVLVTATIDRSGRIVGLAVLSGPAMLQKAAADAVRDARYKPYLLNGQPTEVSTTFSVSFVMGAG